MKGGHLSVADKESGNSWEVREFWTAQQRQGHSLHEISYRACFKPQLPEYFIDHYTEPGDLVADPFLGRGTTPLQAHLMGRRAAGSDVNPLCVMLARPRFDPPPLEAAESRLRDVLDNTKDQTVSDSTENLLAFYHPETLAQLLVLRQWFIDRQDSGELDRIDDWLRMVCLNRLSGHSPGFFSVRTMPPNQAVSAESQRRINERMGQKPEAKDIVDIVMRKSRSLLRSGYPSSQQLSFGDSLPAPLLSTTTANDLVYLGEASVDLVVTSPPFLNIVDYRKDNWLRCWFADINTDTVQISGYSSVEEWRSFVHEALKELCRVVKKGGNVAFEVGEVRNGKVKLEDEVILATEDLPLVLQSVLVNQQKFTKTSNLWGINNNTGGTNTNRVVLLERSD